MKRYHRIIKPFLEQRIETLRKLEKLKISAMQIKFLSQVKMGSIVSRILDYITILNDAIVNNLFRISKKNLEVFKSRGSSNNFFKNWERLRLNLVNYKAINFSNNKNKLNKQKNKNETYSL